MGNLLTICSQERDRNQDIYAEKRMWSSYSLENRDEQEENEAEQEQRRNVNFKGVYGYERDIVLRKQGVFQDKIEYTGLPEPGDGIGSLAIGVSEGAAIHGISISDKYAESYLNLDGEKIKMKGAHDLVWFDERYDTNNQRRTKSVGKLGKRGDETTEEVSAESEMVYEEEAVAVIPLVPENSSSDDEEEEREEGEVRLADFDDSDIEIELSEDDDEELRKQMAEDDAPVFEIDSPRSQFRVSSLIIEGVDEYDAREQVQKQKKQDYNADLKRKLIVGATLGLTAEETLAVERKKRDEKIQEKIDKRVEERKKRFKARILEQDERRAERKVLREAFLAAQALSEEAKKKTEENTVDIENMNETEKLKLKQYKPEYLDDEINSFFTYTPGEMIFAKKKKLNLVDLEREMNEVLVFQKDPKLEGRQNYILRRELQKKDIVEAKKELALKKEANAIANSVIPDAENRRQVMQEKREAARLEREKVEQEEKEKKQKAQDLEAEKQQAEEEKRRKRFIDYGFGKVQHVENNVQQLGMDQFLSYEQLILNPSTEVEWSLFLNQKGKYKYYSAPAASIFPQFKNKDLQVFRGCLFIPNKAPLQVFHELYDVDARMVWDSDSFMLNTTPEQYHDKGYHNEVWYSQCSLPAMKNRDFVEVRGYTMYKKLDGMLASHHNAEILPSNELFQGQILNPAVNYKDLMHTKEVQAVTYVYEDIVHPAHPPIKECERAESTGANLFIAAPMPQNVVVGTKQFAIPANEFADLAEGRPGTFMFLLSCNDLKLSYLIAKMSAGAGQKNFGSWCNTL